MTKDAVHRESPEIAAEDAVPREITEETGLTENTGISQAILVDPIEDTETDGSEWTVAEQVEVTHTIDIEVNAEQAVKKTHKYPNTNNFLKNKIFSVFRQAKESMETMPL